MGRDPASFPFRALRASLDARRLRASELAEAHLERIEALAGLHAYATVDPEGALAAATRADDELDAGHHRGPLHGLPIGLKDNIPVAGLPMRAGSRAFEDFVPASDGAMARAAKEAGAVILGKQTMYEVGLGDPVREGLLANGLHPRNPDYVPGGSSSGSAVATAAGLCALAIGGDSGGSVRNPAACCGVLGFKPTYGRLPSRGTLPYCWSIDTPGILGRDVDTIEAGFATLTDSRDRERPSEPPKLLFLPETTLGEVSDEVLCAYAACREAFALAGASLTPAPRLELESAATAWWARVAEFQAVHSTIALTSWDRYSPSIQSLLERSAAVSLGEYEDSWRIQHRLMDGVDAAMHGYDALLLPANPWPGLRWHEWPGPSVFEWYRFCWPFNITLQPGITIPWSLSADGVPIAYQLVGHRGGDERLLGVAAWCESQGSFDTRPVSPAYGLAERDRPARDALSRGSGSPPRSGNRGIAGRERPGASSRRSARRAAPP